MIQMSIKSSQLLPVAHPSPSLLERLSSIFVCNFLSYADRQRHKRKNITSLAKVMKRSVIRNSKRRVHKIRTYYLVSAQNKHESDEEKQMMVSVGVSIGQLILKFS